MSGVLIKPIGFLDMCCARIGIVLYKLLHVSQCIVHDHATYNKLASRLLCMYISTHMVQGMSH